MGYLEMILNMIVKSIFIQGFSISANFLSTTMVVITKDSEIEEKSPILKQKIGVRVI